MNLEVDLERLRLAHKTVRAELLSERRADGHWVGKVGSSPVATAMAVSALVTAHRRPPADDSAIDNIVQGQLSELVVASLHWLTRAQNEDGGWGDCLRARSNLAATASVQATFRLTGVPAEHADLMARADQFVAAQGGVIALRGRAAQDGAWPAAVLANCALAGMLPWRRVPSLPFEQVGRPPWWRRFTGLTASLPDDSHASTVAFLTAGLLKHRLDPSRNPLTRLTRCQAEAMALARLEGLQAVDGSFFAAPPWTALVVMGLAAAGFRQHSVVERGVEYLLSSVRAGGSWAIVTDLAVRNTALAISANFGFWTSDGESNARADRHSTHGLPSAVGELRSDADDDSLGEYDREWLSTPGLDWLLSCQQTADYEPIGIPPGGWAWSDSPGALPNVGDTAGALLALAHWRQIAPDVRRERVERASRLGVSWILDQQNEEGGWSATCRLHGTSISDSGAVDLTSHSLRAISRWHRLWQCDADGHRGPRSVGGLIERIPAVTERGLAWLAKQERDDGSFSASSFGSEHHADGQNPVYGAASVILACAQLGRVESEMLQRAVGWLIRAQHVGGGWGPPRPPLDYSGEFRSGGSHTGRASEALAELCTVEETAWAVTAMLSMSEIKPACAAAAAKGLNWLAGAIEQDRHRRPAMVGVWPRKLWYDERLYPLCYATAALSRAVRRLASQKAAAVLNA